MFNPKTDTFTVGLFMPPLLLLWARFSVRTWSTLNHQLTSRTDGSIYTYRDGQTGRWKTARERARIVYGTSVSRGAQ